VLIRKALIGILALVAANAQAPDPAVPRGRFGPGPGPVPEGDARFLGAEPVRPGRVIKNAPYTADVITETTKVLVDGNRIHQVDTVHMSRDSEGRTRSEQSLHTLGGLVPNAKLPPVIFINDPVANVKYALNPTAKTATKSSWLPGSGPGPGGRFRRGGSDPNTKTESLGKQTIEGVVANGVRTTQTIPAGQIGNEQAILIVTESWYSPELQTMVYSKRTDPRVGETVMRLSNVSRSEPPHTLFEVPAEFKVSEFGRRRELP